MNNETLLIEAREMRKLILSRKAKQQKKIPLIKSAQIFKQGNFTTVLLNGKYPGISKRNPIDRDSDIGAKLAIRRAISTMLRQG